MNVVGGPLLASKYNREPEGLLASGFLPAEFSSYAPDSKQHEYVLLTNYVNMKPI